MERTLPSARKKNPFRFANFTLKTLHPADFSFAQNEVPWMKRRRDRLVTRRGRLPWGVELELALHNQNLISLGFEESIQTALKDIGGEMLFQMRVEREDCQRIAAVRIGSGEEQQFALVIMPPGGGLMRVEPVEQSSNPLALITESYASLMDTFRA